MRIKMAEPLVKEDHFFVAYGDDVSDILPGNVLKTHVEKGNIATITVIPLFSEFGIVELNGNSKVTAFREKPRIANYWINGGYFCFSKEIFDYLGHEDEELEKEVFRRLSEEGKLGAYIHEGFWKCMNTYKDKLEFEELINENRAPWIKW
jgi:glucose-1-phosphate cytidylyltransferase